MHAYIDGRECDSCKAYTFLVLFPNTSQSIECVNQLKGRGLGTRLTSGLGIIIIATLVAVRMMVGLLFVFDPHPYITYQ